MITIAICENETIFIDKIHKMTSDILGSAHIPFLCSCFSSGEEFLQSLAAGSQYDIVLLDIGLDGINGLQVANQFRNLLHLEKMILIYISSYEERAKEAFPLHTHRFLSKPIDKECFKEALISAYDILKKQQNRFYTFKALSIGQVTLPLDEILYFCVARNRCINLVTASTVYTFYDKITNINEKLFDADFLQIHYSFLINYDHIKMISYTEVKMTDGNTLPISGPKRKDIRNRYAEIQKRREELWR